MSAHLSIFIRNDFSSTNIDNDIGAAHHAMNIGATMTFIFPVHFDGRMSPKFPTPRRRFISKSGG